MLNPLAVYRQNQHNAIIVKAVIRDRIAVWYVYKEQIEAGKINL